jgi:adenosylcobinamide-GDP ribazoletransferase
MRRLGPVYPGLVALARTTSLVAPETPRATEADLGRSAAWMIAVGAVVGATGWLAVKLLVRIGATPALAALVAVLAAGLVAGAVAERGLARWMARLRLGEPLTIGAASLLRWVALVSVTPAKWTAVLIVAPLVGRWAAVFLQAIADPAPFERGARSLVVGQPTFPVIAVLTGLVGAAAILGLGWTGAIGLGGAAAIAFAIGLRAQRRDGGIDGDVVAAAAVLGELAIAIAAALAFPTPISPWQR